MLKSNLPKTVYRDVPAGIAPGILEIPKSKVSSTTTVVNQLYYSANGLWLYNAGTNAVSGYPGNGYLLWDNATQTSAAHLIFSHLTDDNLDIDLLLALLVTNTVLIVQDANDSLNYQKWTLSGPGVNTNPGASNSYWTFPVTLTASGGTGTTGFPNNHNLAVFVHFPTAGGGGGAKTRTVVVFNPVVSSYTPTADPTVIYVLVNNALGTSNVFLPDPTVHKNVELHLRAITGTISLSRHSTETIDGAAGPLTIAGIGGSPRMAAISLLSDGTNWWSFMQEWH